MAPAPFVEKMIIPPFNCFCTFVKNTLDVFVWGYFWLLYHVPLVHVSVLPPTLHNIQHYTIVCVCVHILGLVPVHTNYRIHVSITTGHIAVIWLGITLNL